MKEGGSRSVFICWLLLTACPLSRHKMEKGGKKMEGKFCVHSRLLLASMSSWRSDPEC